MPTTGVEKNGKNASLPKTAVIAISSTDRKQPMMSATCEALRYSISCVSTRFTSMSTQALTANSAAGAERFRALDTEHAALRYDGHVRARNGGFSEQVAAHPLREAFFRELARTDSVVALLRRTIRPTLWQRLRRRFRKRFTPDPHNP